MANKVFERREKKYLLGARQRQTIEEAARPYLAPDAFGCSLITSVYLDTPDREVIARSLEKPIYKEKLRLRAYGDPASEALVFLCREGLQAAEAAYGDGLLAIPVFFELKKKFKGIVYKRRIRLSLPAAWAFLQGASYEAANATYPLEDPAESTGERATGADDSYIDRQIAHELEAALGRHDDLRPAAAVFCQRTAWAPIDGEEGLRLTFDDDLRFLDLLVSDAEVRPIIAADLSVMEVKSVGGLPSWFIATLSETGSYPSSFSKYGEAARLMKKGV